MRRPCEGTSQSVTSSCYQHHHAHLSSDADWRSGQASIWSTGEATAKALRARPRWNFDIVWILGPFLSMAGRLATGRGRHETDLTGSSAWSARHLASHQHATIIRLLYLVCCGVVLCPHADDTPSSARCGPAAKVSHLIRRMALWGIYAIKLEPISLVQAAGQGARGRILAPLIGLPPTVIVIMPRSGARLAALPWLWDGTDVTSLVRSSGLTL